MRHFEAHKARLIGEYSLITVEVGVKFRWGNFFLIFLDLGFLCGGVKTINASGIEPASQGLHIVLTACARASAWPYSSSFLS